MESRRSPVIPPAAPRAAGGSPGPVRRLPKWLPAALCAVAFPVAAVAASPVVREPPPSRFASDASAHSTLRVSGRVKGLSPGISRVAWVSVRNLSARPLGLRRLWAGVGDGAAGCRARWLRLRAFAQQRRLNPGGRVRVPAVIGLSPAAPDACQGASFPLRWHARAAGP